MELSSDVRPMPVVINALVVLDPGLKIGLAALLANFFLIRERNQDI